MSAKERLKKFVEYKNMGRNRFEESVGISLGYISSKSPSVGSEIVEKIVSRYPDLNVEWLITGIGNMTKQKGQTVSWNEVRSISSDMKVMQVPLVSQYAQAGYLGSFNDTEYMESLPTLPIVADHEGKGNYMCFEVRGDSMNDGSENSYKAGDVLVCREVDAAYWTSRLHFNKWKAFVIVHQADGIVVKQITAHNLDNNTITIHSLNPLYEDKVIYLGEIQKIFNVIKIQRDESR